MTKQKQYIDRNALLRQAETMFDGQREVMGVKAEHIYSAPVAEVAEVVHGEWIVQDRAIPLGELTLTGRFPVCSVCEMVFAGTPNFELAYCPQCGAKMDGGKHDKTK